MTNLYVTAKLPRRDEVRLVLPAELTVATTLRLSPRARDIPTLLSVERIIGKLAEVGIVLADSKSINSIAGAINKQFLVVPREAWKDCELKIGAETVPGDENQEGLKAVEALRRPSLAAAEAVMVADSQNSEIAVREQENLLATSLTAAVMRHRPVWQKYAPLVFSLVAKTALGAMTHQLLAVPLTDVIQQALGGVTRRV
jgi:hypothetical protein